MDPKRVPVTTKRRRSEDRRRHGLHDRRPHVNALPEQFFDSRISLAGVCPETALMYAVLEDALLCFQETVASSPPQQRCRAQETERWFFSNDQHSPYSFVRICAELGLDSEDIRNKLKYLGQATRSKPISSKKTLHRSPQRLVIAEGLPALVIIERIGRSHYDSRPS